MPKRKRPRRALVALLHRAQCDVFDVLNVLKHLFALVTDKPKVFHAGEQDVVVKRVGRAVQSGAAPLPADVEEQRPRCPVFRPDVDILRRGRLASNGKEPELLLLLFVGFRGCGSDGRRVQCRDGLRQFPNRPSMIATRYVSKIASAAPGSSSHSCCAASLLNSTSRFQPSRI